jgi:anti-sigma B factor antagonist
VTKILTQASVEPGRLTIAEDFGIAIEHGDETVVVALAGEVDLYRAPAIEQAFEEAAEPRPGLKQGRGRARTLIVDLQAVTFLDSTMLGLLIAAHRRQGAHGGDLLILTGPQTPMSAFQVTGFDRLLSIKSVDANRDESSVPAPTSVQERGRRTGTGSAAALTAPTSPSDAK